MTGDGRKEQRDDYSETKTRPLQSECNDGLWCNICGGRMVSIRGRHPGMDNRIVCPTCIAEVLDDLKERLRSGFYPLVI